MHEEFGPIHYSYMCKACWQWHCQGGGGEIDMGSFTPNPHIAIANEALLCETLGAVG